MNGPLLVPTRPARDRRAGNAPCNMAWSPLSFHRRTDAVRTVGIVHRPAAGVALQIGQAARHRGGWHRGNRVHVRLRVLGAQ